MSGKMKIECQVELKPLSANQCWQGRRFKTSKYKLYEKELLNLLPDGLEIPSDKNIKLQVYIRWGLSSSLFDWDNGIKPFQDVLQKKYNFDDRYIYLGIVEKTIVPKGEEYIYFCIKELSPLEKIRILIKEMFK